MKSTNHQCMVAKHFKMNSLDNVKKIFQQEDVMSMIYKDTYLTVNLPFEQEIRSTYMKQTRYTCTSLLPFIRLVSAPRTFTKLLKPVFDLLQRQDQRMIIYTVNILLISSTVEEDNLHLKLTVIMIEKLGFTIDYPESVVLQPS